MMITITLDCCRVKGSDLELRKIKFLLKNGKELELAWTCRKYYRGGNSFLVKQDVIVEGITLDYFQDVKILSVETALAINGKAPQQKDFAIKSMKITDGKDTLEFPYPFASHMKIVDRSAAQGICPVCGREITYIERPQETLSNGFALNGFAWKCPFCMASGKESTSLPVVSQWEVKTKEGYPVVGLRSGQVKHPKPIYANLLAHLPKEPGNGPFWTNGDEILCCHEYQSHVVADFLEALGIDATTGYFVPEEDKLDGCEDPSTGFYYIR